MPRNTSKAARRNLQQAAELTSTPPDDLTSTQFIARIVKSTGNHIYSVAVPSSCLPDHNTDEEVLVELPSCFRSTIWIRRNGYVLVDTTASEERDNKIQGKIANIVRNEKAWRKMHYWPAEFVKTDQPYDDSDDEDNVVGRMPPSSDDEN